MERFNLNFLLAITGIAQNKLRSLLTALGIIFGVFAVIAMMAIGNGAEKSILDQLKIVGTNNIIVTAIPPSEQNEEEEGDNIQQEDKKLFSPGLSPADVTAIRGLLENDEAVSMEIGTDSEIIYGNNTLKTRLLGVNNDFFNINSLNLLHGVYFNDYHHKVGDNVCVLGGNIAKKLFLGKSPLGKYIKVKQVIFKVIGVIQNRLISEENYQSLGINNYGNQVFIPFQSYRMRIENKGKINQGDILTRGRREGVKNYHQLDKIILKIDETAQVETTGAVIAKLLKRKHNNREDFKVEIPELLIKQQQDTQSTLNFVFAIIAGISLLVGGIGIMNIMLASVMERIKEIGLRRSIGATRKDIISQFLLEAIVISLIGGVIGIILGIIGSWIIANYVNIPTVISIWSILISFVIAVSIGMIFGMMPARKAALLDPINALRTE